ncbi:unnamed protein product [Sphenostylis stenocarpa]|uniref:Uncharacterized protein n=1 Tax=Sphenostylis stenocarpa TaxID=92480 RepID=A0AA86THU4_9FABA|nr:unnamed protein product [Sphenostylis stenocarpa]
MKGERRGICRESGEELKQFPWRKDEDQSKDLKEEGSESLFCCLWCVEMHHRVFDFVSRRVLVNPDQIPRTLSLFFSYLLGLNFGVVLCVMIVAVICVVMNPTTSFTRRITRHDLWVPLC